MRGTSPRRVKICFLAFAILGSPLFGSEPLVLINGNLYTGDDLHPRADAVACVDGRIAFVGSAADARQHAPAGARVLDLHGQTVLPGLTDAHAHLSGIGFRELNFNLEGTNGIPDLQARLKQRIAEIGPRKWISGRGWIESHWSPPQFPTKADLDAVSPDNPVVLGRSDGHAIVVNSLALKLAHVDRSTPNPTGGEILHDPATGEPTGLLTDNAMELVRHLVPGPTDAELAQALEVGAAREVRLGWTTIHIAGNDYNEVGLIRKLIGEGKMKLRISDAIYGPSKDVDRLLAEGPSIGEFDGRFSVRGIKLYIDGALGSRGAALLEAYSDAPGERGVLVNQESVLFPILVAALRQGVQVQTHAIGDRGNRVMLNLYEKAFATVPVAERKVADPRWRIEHAQILSPADIPRFAKLGVIPSMQASHAIGDLYFAPARLGPARLAGAYAWRSLLDTGVIIPGGSDAPVERGEPMIEFYAAVTRRSLDGFSNDDWHREQRVTRAEALKMYTLWPAYAAFQENDRGMITAGQRADFTVLSQDIMQIPEPEILKTHCVMTIIAGEIVYGAELHP
jgi:predicted amidohydrolase YtcJ